MLLLRNTVSPPTKENMEDAYHNRRLCDMFTGGPKRKFWQLQRAVRWTEGSVLVHIGQPRSKAI